MTPLGQELVITSQIGATTTFTSPDISTNGCNAIHVTLSMITVGTGSVTLSINGKDKATGVYYNLLSGAAVITNVNNTYIVGPGLPVTTNVSANNFLPETIQIVATANNANATTYTIGANLKFI